MVKIQLQLVYIVLVLNKIGFKLVKKKLNKLIIILIVNMINIFWGDLVKIEKLGIFKYKYSVKEYILVFNL